MVIYELYGCPGTGKSTVAGKVIGQLRECGLSCASYRDLYFNGNPGKIQKIRNYLGVIADRKAGELKKEIFRLCSWSGGNRKYGWYLLSLCHRIRRAETERTERIAVLDEGVIQFISSLTHGKPIAGYPCLNELLKQLEVYGIHVNGICCQLPLQENIKRLRERGKDKPTRFLEIKDDAELRRALEGRWENLKEIASRFPQVCTLDMSLDAEKNAQNLKKVVISGSAPERRQSLQAK